MAIFLWTIGLILALGYLAFCGRLSWRILRSPHQTRAQRAAQTGIVWLAPLVGPCFIWLLRRMADAPFVPGDPDWPAPPPNRYPSPRG